MFKVTNQPMENGVPSNFYTVTHYVFDKNTRLNTLAWSASNKTDIEVAELLQGRTIDCDADWSFAVLKSGNGPVILASSGELLPTPVKVRLNAHQGAKETRNGTGNRKKKRESAGARTRG